MTSDSNESWGMKGLIVDEPWISLILQGEKIWEMRKTACHHRGRIALIRKGSGQVVGTAALVNSLNPLLSATEYAEAEPKHRIPRGRQAQAFADGWRTPWVLANARPLSRPVPYKHPSGAVIWVNLGQDVLRAIEAQSNQVVDKVRIPAKPDSVELDEEGDRHRSYFPRALPPLPLEKTAKSPPHPRSAVPVEPRTDVARSGTSRIVKVTGGNIRNNHIYVPLDFFPSDAIGGGNRSEIAPRAVTITFSPGSTIETDIDGTKRILRARSAVADFISRAGLKEGDAVRLSSTAPYCYKISKETNAR